MPTMMATANRTVGAPKTVEVARLPAKRANSIISGNARLSSQARPLRTCTLLSAWSKATNALAGDGARLRVSAWALIDAPRFP